VREKIILTLFVLAMLGVVMVPFAVIIPAAKEAGVVLFSVSGIASLTMVIFSVWKEQ